MEPHTAPTLSKSTLFILALCAGAAVANLYYAQPLLAEIGASFGSPNQAGLVAVATQLGYTLGILFIVPLGDLVERKRLTICLAGVLVVAALACALATSLQMLAATSLLVGVGATITQILVPFAADLAAPAQRGRAVGTVFSGIMAGILLARTVSGLVGEWLGWRPMFGLASGVALLLAVVLGVRLPTAAPRLKQSYGALLGSMVRLLRQHRALRVACAVQACVFAIFSAFWSILALLLAQEPFHLGPAAAGAFGIVGVVGVAAANASGRLIDRFGTRKVLTLGLGCCVLAWAIFAVDVSLRGLVLGVLVLDFGMSIANVANQTMVLGLDAQARSRINTIYVTAIFLGGSVGTAVASLAWAHGGWPIVCAFGLATALLAAAIHANEGRTKQ